MNGKPLSITMIIAFGSLLGLYSAAMLVSRFSEPARILERNAPWLLAGDEESQLSRAYERMGQGDSAGLSEAITMFTTMMARNPASPYRWCDLGEALLEAGEVQP